MSAMTTTKVDRSRPQTSRRRPVSSAQSRRVNLFYVPALVLFAVFMIYPLVSGIQLSFTNWDGFSSLRSFVGWDNYARLLDDANFRTVMINTLIYGVGSTIIQQAIGLSAALALNRKFRGRSALRAIVYLPALVSPVIMGVMYYLIFQYNNGALNSVVVAFGGERTAWFNDANLSVAIIVLVNSLQFSGISMLIYLAGLQSIPADVQEAAMLDGAGGWQMFRSVTLPLLQPAFATSIVLNLIGGLKLFDVIRVLTGGGPGYSTNSVSTFISLTYFDNQSAGYASAMGVVLFVLIAVSTLALNKVLNRRALEA